MYVLVLCTIRSQQALFSAHAEVEDLSKEKLLKAGKSIYPKTGIRKMHEVLNMDSQIRIDLMSRFHFISLSFSFEDQVPPQVYRSLLTVNVFITVEKLFSFEIFAFQLTLMNNIRFNICLFLIFSFQKSCTRF